MTALDLALAATLAYYMFFVLRVFVGLHQLSTQERSAETPSVTIVIAARNEAGTIEKSLRSVLNQAYPRHLLTVVVVDDASTDDTGDRVRKVAADDRRVSLITMPPRTATGIGGKPEAIRAGVEQATGSIVITTDADCFHPTTWVQTMVSYFMPSTALVAGPVSLTPATSWFGRIERLDFLGLVTSGAGLIGAGRPIICNGANLAYRRTAYLAARKDVQHSSNDDGTLMSRIVTRGLGSVAFAFDAGALVETHGQGSIRAFFRQRRRWAAVSGRFLDATIYVELALLFSFFVILLTATFTSPLHLASLRIVLWGWIIKMAVDVPPLLTAMRAWNIERRWMDVIAAELFHPFSIVVATVLSVAAPFRWKDRTLTR